MTAYFTGQRQVAIGDDLIDSRDIIAWIDDLQGDEDNLDDDERAELAMLREFAEEASGYMDDWRYGETLIHDRYFQTYAEQLAEDIGAIGRDMQWPLTYIDWEAAAEALQQDYTSIEVDGHTYWGR